MTSVPVSYTRLRKEVRVPWVRGLTWPAPAFNPPPCRLVFPANLVCSIPTPSFTWMGFHSLIHEVEIVTFDLAKSSVPHPIQMVLAA